LIKLDARFVRGSAGNDSRRTAVQRLVDVAVALGAEVVAEGVESRDDMRFLHSLGVPLAQGFLWGRPRELEVSRN
jgi:EAL domain-containing protein (putative c-di-GMP-specific phosphodiesterase class I)